MSISLDSSSIDSISSYPPESPAASIQESPEEPIDSTSEETAESEEIEFLRTFRLAEQDYFQLRDESIATGHLFEDPLFDAIDTNVFYSKDKFKKYAWKRPKNMSKNPSFIVNDATRFDVNQGRLSNCWFAAAMASLATNELLFHKVVPADQTFDEDEKYAGIFRFRLWRYGEWTDFVVDDRLPTDKGFVFTHSKALNEFWSPLLEKAYAKLHGSYEALGFGDASEALMDFSGGLLERYNPLKPPHNLFSIMFKANERSSLICAAIYGSKPGTTVAPGLVIGHVYTVTDVETVTILKSRPPEKVGLLRVRNPWGTANEWKGAWSDKSDSWKTISDEEKKLLKPVVAADGEFWMAFSDFKKYFNVLEICHLTPDMLYASDTSSQKRWEVTSFDGSWVRGSSAGGSRKFMNTFPQNPQYRIKLKDPDEHDNDKKCTLILAIMQKYDRSRYSKTRKQSIGFALYFIQNPGLISDPAPRWFFENNRDLASNNIFSYNREVNQRFHLNPGTYCVVPSTFNPRLEGQFLLRAFTEKKFGKF